MNTVKHLLIDGEQITNNSINYFPNVNELTMKISTDSISTILNQIIPLKQLMKLTIGHVNFPYEQLMELVRFTPNLHTVKYLSPFNVKQTDVSKINHIKRLEICREGCTIEQFEIILNLFPQLEHFKTGMWKNDIEQFIPYLSSTARLKTHPLFFLGISDLRRKYIPELNRLMKSKNLHDYYFIKIVYPDLYLWW